MGFLRYPNLRILINLKPLEERGASAAEVIRRLQPRLAPVQGISLFMQPVQDLTIEDRVSRTQYRYSVEDADPRELSLGVSRLVERLSKLPELTDGGSTGYLQGAERLEGGAAQG